MLLRLSIIVSIIVCINSGVLFHTILFSNRNKMIPSCSARSRSLTKSLSLPFAVK